MTISEVNILPIKHSNGLVGFASCVIDEKIFIGSMGIHKKLDGSGYRLTYPTKKLGTQQLNYYHPISRELGLEIEHAVTTECHNIFEGSDNHDRYGEDTTTHP